MVYLNKSETSLYLSTMENLENANFEYSEEEDNQIKGIPDFVLVFNKNSENDEDDMKRNIRGRYEEKLREKGLNLVMCPDIDDDHSQIFVYATNDILLEYAELLKLRLPISEKKLIRKQNDETDKNYLSTMKKLLKKNLRVDVESEKTQNKILTMEYSRNREYLFDTDLKNVFTQSDRSMIVSYILELDTFNDESNESETIGIRKLIADKVYTSAYPVHDEKFRKPLLEEWASMRVWYKNQPIDKIKDYFGVKIALYFAWLGFYTDMLVPISIFGVLCVFYGWATISTDELSIDICNPKMNMTMCPQCDKNCDYWDLTDACLYSKITHTFDNWVTMLFAIVMSIWSSLYLSLWKSYSAELLHRWGLSGINPEAYCPRPEYLSRLKELEQKKNIKMHTKMNKITEKEEAVVPWRVKLPVVAFSFTFALFWVAILMAVLLAILVFRVSAITSEELYEDDAESSELRAFIVPVTAALIDLTCILILNNVYDYVAQWLTEKEFLRTQSQFDDSLTLKIYTFQFINYYSGFFYIAFIKGRFVGTPAHYNRFLGKRLEECSPGGCLMELCIQLAIVMIGDQLFGQFTEYGLPFIQKKWNERQINKHKHKELDGVIIVEDNLTSKSESAGKDDLELLDKGERSDVQDADVEDERISNSSENNNVFYENNDHQLLSWSVRGLFDEYLEMVIQYGFVTLFVTAFPLAPLCALFNNIIELRWDARKFLRDYRRPVAQTIKSIGVWLKIIDLIGKLAIVSNAFIIAFSSNFIPRFIYVFFDSPDRTTDGFLEWSLASFAVNDFEEGSAPLNSSYNGTTCLYPDYRRPHDDVKKYNRSKRFWHILAARIIFVLLYQNLVVLCKMCVKWFVPETPKRLKTQIMKEQWAICKIITQHQMEQKRAKSRANSLNDLDEKN